MQAMVLRRMCDLEQNSEPLTLEETPTPVPEAGELLVRVEACGVCHTELDEIEGRLPPSELPRILGHQVVGRVEDKGAETSGYAIGDRVGVAWIFSACGRCELCRGGMENLCSEFRGTGRDAHGGYAEYMRVPSGFAHAIPERLSAVHAAPLLCAGAIGYRSLRLAKLEDGQRLGLTGFGASAHLVLALVRQRFPASEVYVFARSAAERSFARDLGAVWAGPSEQRAPERLHAIIDTTPAWKPIVDALEQLLPGGRLVVNAIRKQTRDLSELQRIDYATHLWMEKEIKSVANVTRRDVREFLDEAARMKLAPTISEFALAEANEALLQLHRRQIRGAKVLVI